MKFVSRLHAMLAVLFHGKIPVFVFLLSYGVLVDATICPHCKDTILPAAHVAAACPLVTELKANAVIFNTKKLGTSPTVIHSMTHELAMQFTRPVVDAIVGLACAPTQGTSIDFTDAAYTQANAQSSRRLSMATAPSPRPRRSFQSGSILQSIHSLSKRSVGPWTP